MVALTLTEAAGILDPPMSETTLRIIVRALAIQPVSTRHSGQAGRPVAEYDAGEIHRLHGALAPWLALTGFPCIMGLTPHAQTQAHEVVSCRKAPP